MTKTIKIDKDQVYFDPRAKVLFTIKSIGKKFTTVGGVSSPFLDDARTSYCRYRISNEYLKGCQTIDETSPLVQKDESIESFRLVGRDPMGDYLWKIPKEFKYLNYLTGKIMKKARGYDY